MRPAAALYKFVISIASEALEAVRLSAALDSSSPTGPDTAAPATPAATMARGVDGKGADKSGERRLFQFRISSGKKVARGSVPAEPPAEVATAASKVAAWHAHDYMTT